MQNEEKPQVNNHPVIEMTQKYNQILKHAEMLTTIVEIQTSIITNLYTGMAESIPQKYMNNPYLKRVGELTLELNRFFEQTNGQENTKTG